MNKQHTLDSAPTTIEELRSVYRLSHRVQPPFARLLGWWYPLTAPTLAVATSAPRNTARGWYTTSLLSFILLVFTVIVALPLALFYDHTLLIGVVIILACTFFALLFNQQRRNHLAGILLVIGVEAALISMLLTAPTGLHSMPLYDLLVIADLVTIVALPATSILLLALLNCVFIGLHITLQYHALASTQLVIFSDPMLYLRPLLLQCVVALVAFYCAFSMHQAIARADRADELAALEHELVKQSHVVTEEKYQLEASIQRIAETHSQVAMGNLSARVPLDADNQLWGIASSLNGLLARLQKLHYTEAHLQQLQPRLQRASQLEYEFKKVQPYLQQANQIEQSLTQTGHEIVRLQQMLRKARLHHIPFAGNYTTGTLVDVLINELNGCQLPPLPVSGPDRTPQTDKIASFQMPDSQALRAVRPRARTTIPLPHPSSPGITAPLNLRQDEFQP